MSSGRFLFLINHLDVGGAQTVLINGCNALEAQGAEVHLVTLKPGRMFLAGRLAPTVQVHDPLCFRTRSFIPASRRLRELIGRIKPDAVHAHLPVAAYLGALACGGESILVATEHGRPPPGGIFLKALERWTERRLNHRIFVSRNLRDSFLAAGITTRDKSAVIYNPVPLPAVDAAEARTRIREELGVSPGTTVFNFTGALRPVKNLPRLIRAFASFIGSADRRRNSVLLVVGDGRERTRAESLCRELDMETSVRFMGNRNSVNDYFAASDIFVMTSLTEAFPMALVEAMLCGVVPVCTSVGGVPELLEDGVNGFLLDPDDGSGDAAVLERAATADLKAMGERASESAAAASSPENHAMKLMELYSGLKAVE